MSSRNPVLNTDQEMTDTELNMLTRKQTKGSLWKPWG